MSARALTIAAAFALFVVSGCGPAKLDMTKTYNLTPLETQSIILPAQPKPQRITVEYEADNPIEVGVYKSEDIKNPEDSLPTSKALVLEKAKASGSFAVDLGPDVSTTVTVTSFTKKTTVKVNLTNRK